MDIKGKNILILGGCGLVGKAVCRELLTQSPARLVLASRRRKKAEKTVNRLLQLASAASSCLLPAWGDVFLRADWQVDDCCSRAEILANPEKRGQLVSDIMNPLDHEIVQASLLTQLIQGTAPERDAQPAQIVIDCMNTATVISYQDIYGVARRLTGLAGEPIQPSELPRELEELLAALPIPTLVRHQQILYEAMARAGTEAYIKVGTSGTGGMGFNIPYTHGEEKPSQLLMTKCAVAGAQTLLTFLMARSPAGPHIVKEIKPTALIGWKEINHGLIRQRGKTVRLYDCPLDQAVSILDPNTLAPQGEFGQETDEILTGVYIDTGENGLFSSAEFATITALGQMQMVTPEEIAANLVAELRGSNTGREVIGALDGAVTGPSFRAGHLRQTALNRLQQLEENYGEAVAFENLGPPRLSKLLFEAFLLKRVYPTMAAALQVEPELMAEALGQEVAANDSLRRRMISIGIPILLRDGRQLLRGPVIKSNDAHHGWVDLTPANMMRWQQRLRELRQSLQSEFAGDSSSRHDRVYPASQQWQPKDDSFRIGELTAFIMTYEEGGKRLKS